MYYLYGLSSFQLTSIDASERKNPIATSIQMFGVGTWTGLAHTLGLVTISLEMDRQEAPKVGGVPKGGTVDG